MTALVLLTAALLAAAPTVPSGQATEIAEPIAPQRLSAQPLDPEREARVHRLGKLIRCPMCQALSIADSSSASARAQLEKIRELVRQGQSDPEILAYFEARYGEFALLEPKREGLSLLVWVTPIALLLVGAWVVLSQVRRERPAGGSPAPAAAAPEDEYLARVRKDLES